MKKNVLIAAMMLIGTMVFGQAVREGNVIIDPYYGYPNFGKSFTDQVSEGIDDVNVTGYGPAGLRVEYMVGDQFGIGVDAIFNGFGVEGTRTDSTYNATTMTYDVTTTQTRSIMQRLRIQARFNYHFDIANPDLDAYFGVGAGTNNRFYKYYENGVESDDNQEFTLLPVSFRIATGMRYYFTENIGINAELGLGGPVLSAGLSIKI